MKDTLTADIIFPAFGAEYLNCEKEIVLKESEGFEPYLQKAGDIVDIDRDLFLSENAPPAYNELQAQFKGYIYSVIFSDIIKQKRIQTGLVGAYSMGLYGASYHCGVISFEVGLKIINDAYTLVNNAIGDRKFAMGVVVGLDIEDIKSLIHTHCPGVEITNINNKYQIIVSGPKEEVYTLIDNAQNEGALKAYPLNIKAPYHTTYVKSTALEFKNKLKNHTFSPPVFPLVSSLDHELCKTAEAFKDEMVKNIYVTSNWYKTMDSLVQQGSGKIIECGPGKSLSAIARFIEGDFKIYNIKQLYKKNFEI